MLLMVALNGKKRKTPPVAKKLDGKQEAQVIALRLGSEPKGFSNWSLRLLADKVVELGIVESIRMGINEELIGSSKLMMLEPN